MDASGDVRQHRRRATLKDVARRAGVSVQTASNALNGTGRLSAGTRERVLQAVRDLGYHPHTGAASLRSGRVNRLLYPLPTGPASSNPIMLDFLQQIVAAAARRRQQVMVMSPDGDDPGALDELIDSRTVDGVLLSAVVAGDRRVRHLGRLGVPFVCFGRTDPGLPQCWVDVDGGAGIREVTERMVTLGWTRIAFIGYDSRRPWDLDREAGYRSAMAAAGLPAEVTLVGVGRETPAVAALLERLRAGALVTGSDVLAARCYAAAHAAGLVIGTDLVVSGFDGSAVSRLLVPSLTTVAVPLPLIADRMVARVLGEIPNDSGEMLPTELILAESTGHPDVVPGTGTDRGLITSAEGRRD